MTIELLVTMLAQYLMSLGYIEGTKEQFHSLAIWLHRVANVSCIDIEWSKSDLSRFQPFSYGGRVYLGKYSGMRQARLVWVLSHEICHAWQNQFTPAILSNYQNVDTGAWINWQEHDNHPAEVQANQFADSVLKAMGMA